MTRARDLLAGLYHVTTRGVDHRDIFGDPVLELRSSFIRMLDKTVRRCGVVCHAYCLMDNHYHLLIETLEHGELARALQYLNGTYAGAFNELTGRGGHLFERRYRSVRVEIESHALEVARYVVLNPVRAELVRSASDWRWSSYRAMSGLVSARPFLTTNWTLRLFDENADRARVRYAQFVAEGIGAPRPAVLAPRPIPRG